MVEREAPIFWENKKWQWRSKLLSLLPVNHVFIFPANLLSIFSMLFFNAFCQKNINFPSHAHQWAKRIKLLIFLNCTKCILRTTAKLYQVRKKSNNTQRTALDGGTMIFFSVLCRNTGLPALRKKKTAPTVTVKNV